MTALGDAYKKAGGDPAPSEAYLLATQILRAKDYSGDPKKALSHFVKKLQECDGLLNAVALDYLTRVAADMNASKVAPPQINNDEPKPQAKSPRKRTAGERSAALQAAKVEVDVLRSFYDERKIGDRAIGDIRWGEVTRLVHAGAVNCASLLRLGTGAAADILLLKKLKEFVSVTDHSLTVRRVISAKDLQRLDEAAQREAPRAIEYFMQRQISLMENYQQKELT